MTCIGEDAARLANSSERLAQLGFICAKSRDRHCSAYPQSGVTSQSIRNLRDLREVKASLRFLSGRIHLNEHFNRTAALSAESIHCVSQSRAVQSMKQRESVERFDLVALKVADEVPADRLSYLLDFTERFLHAVLADVGNSSSECRLNSLRTVGLGDSDDLRALPMPSPLRCGLDSLSDGCDPSAQLWKKHSREI